MQGTVDISRIFTSNSTSILGFFQQAGLGYYIPLYQREYSWDTENIDQLLEDILNGLENIVDENADVGRQTSPDQQIHFMGTIILVTEKEPIKNIKPLDQRALPTRVDNVIDGQQRLSTIALLSCQLYKEIYELQQRLSDTDSSKDAKEAAQTYLENLKDLFSVDIKRGSPQRKPVIIRASVDQWTLDGNDDNYKSPVSSYLASFIRAINTNEAPNFPPVRGRSLVQRNLKKMSEFLSSEKTSLPSGPKVLKAIDAGKITELELWSYPREALLNRIRQIEDNTNSLSDEDRHLSKLVRLFAVCDYLLNRCCFTVIKPESDVRAFDMFQSLNATGTPLTAYETFKPLVVNYVESSGASFQNSNSDRHLKSVDDLLSSETKASAKSKITNDFLTAFALAQSGFKLSKQFSTQRRWLCNSYENKCRSDSGKEEFLQHMGELAIYWREVVQFEPSKKSYVLESLPVQDQDKKVSTVCLLYLRDANHRMALTVLSRFYSKVLHERDSNENILGSVQEFISALKVTTAFYTIWRSSLSNSGLDDVYRDLLAKEICWEKGNERLTAKFLSEYFQGKLAERGIGNRVDWLNKAKSFLRYDESKVVCKFSLFVTAEDTIPDPDCPGLMKEGLPGSTPEYLTPEKWNSPELSTIEHIAPQKNQSSNDLSQWDDSLYEDDNYQRIGNLTLLPVDVNSSLSNKGWIEKFIYYQHLSQKDPDRLAELTSQAQERGINLSDQAIKLLTNSSHNSHILPIVELGSEKAWDKELVEKRSERICSILWERLYSWLSVS
ncbi:DUF262 domain-containing protein [Thermoleptolyngbya oregonensis NK1-22]|uniref:DUF262 domain-containing protein n=1 Tax=Thermoleptolyngbya oregonensis NK1-22 TaxID=2547457 RepID=A0AA96YNM3_9CYAN|nr:DUF262 domain-containing HNH endonuclease family protein [Thermoleptolyngbya oregonensis]WOB43537.1 DUF262 domain-containing protein [Thermoleptolyngbya oregonensis NK1-22]